MANPLEEFIDTPKGKGKAIAEWARVIGVSRSLMYKLLRGTRNPSLATAFKIEDATEGAVPIQAWRGSVTDGSKQI